MVLGKRVDVREVISVHYIDKNGQTYLSGGATEHKNKPQRYAQP